mgnify:FL=1
MAKPPPHCFEWNGERTRGGGTEHVELDLDKSVSLTRISNNQIRTRQSGLWRGVVVGWLWESAISSERSPLSSVSRFMAIRGWVGGSRGSSRNGGVGVGRRVTSPADFDLGRRPLGHHRGTPCEHLPQFQILAAVHSKQSAIRKSCDSHASDECRPIRSFTRRRGILLRRLERCFRSTRLACAPVGTTRKHETRRDEKR